MIRWCSKVVVLFLVVAMIAGSAGMIGSAEAAEFKWYNPATWMNSEENEQETIRKREEADRKAELERKQEAEKARARENAGSGVKWYNPATWVSAEENEEEARRKREAARKEARRKQKLEDERIKAREEEEARKKAEKERKEAAKEDKRQKKQAIDKAAAKGGQLGALIQTQRGNITIALFEDEAPVTVRNFKRLVEDKFYDSPNMMFHRVVPGFVVQTGDPTGTGYGGSKESIPLEVDNKLMHDGKGVVAMARGARPDSATSQFYITLTSQKQLDGKYAIFGQVVSGLDVLDKIEKGDKVYGVKLIDLSSVVRDKSTASEEPGMFKKIFSNPF